MSAVTRVQKGAKFLDKMRPGWAPKIKVPKLDLREENVCILGQLFGHYDKGMEKLLNEDHKRAKQLGFDAKENTQDLWGDNDKAYCELTKLWAFEVGKRQARAHR